MKFKQKAAEDPASYPSTQSRQQEQKERKVDAHSLSQDRRDCLIYNASQKHHSVHFGGASEGMRGATRHLKTLTST
jgi:hypothetical protein